MNLHNVKILVVIATLSAMITGCGGSTMSAGGNNLIKKKERKEKSESESDAKDPQVVTGAYLSCEPSPKDGSDAVGCSIYRSDDTVIKATPKNGIAFYRSVNNGPYVKSNQSNASGFQAVFATPKSELAKTRFIATYANRYGMDEVSCTSIPCKNPVKMNAVPTFVSLAVSAVWRVDDGLIGGATNLFDFIDTKNYCSGGSIRFNKSPAENASAWVEVIGNVGGNFTKIEPLTQLYAEVSKFRKNRLRSGKFYETGNGCIVTPLRKIGPAFHPNQMTQAEPKINTDNFHLIMLDNEENRTAIKDFIDDLH